MRKFIRIQHLIAWLRVCDLTMFWQFCYASLGGVSLRRIYLALLFPYITLPVNEVIDYSFYERLTWLNFYCWVQFTSSFCCFISGFNFSDSANYIGTGDIVLPINFSSRVQWLCTVTTLGLVNFWWSELANERKREKARFVVHVSLVRVFPANRALRGQAVVGENSVIDRGIMGEGSPVVPTILDVACIILTS